MWGLFYRKTPWVDVAKGGAAPWKSSQGHQTHHSLSRNACLEARWICEAWCQNRLSFENNPRQHLWHYFTGVLEITSYRYHCRKWMIVPQCSLFIMFSLITLSLADLVRNFKEIAVIKITKRQRAFVWKFLTSTGLLACVKYWAPQKIFS